MALSLASIGERASQARPLDRLLQNVGILARSSRDIETDGEESASGDFDAEATDAETPPDSEQDDTTPISKTRVAKRYGADEYVPLRARMNAWWHGDTISRRNAPSASTNVETAATIDMTKWTKDRMELVQWLWGEGFLEPGGAAAVRKLFLHVLPNSKQSVLDLTTGLGGTAFTLAHDQNLWMDALEWDDILVAEANRGANKNGLVDQVPVGKLKLDAINIAEKKYNLIYSRERLFTVVEKIELLTAAAEGLRAGGNLVITDLVVTSTDRLESEGFGTWVRSEPVMPQPWTMALYVKTLKELGLSVVTRQDSTKQYLSDITAGWRRVAKLLQGGDFNPDLANQLLAEGDFWIGRTTALEAGDISLCRLIARRP